MKQEFANEMAFLSLGATAGSVMTDCENYVKNMNCEDMDTCPAYKLYLLAKKKRKVVY